MSPFFKNFIVSLSSWRQKKLNHKHIMQEKGFSLLEIIIVITIIGGLVALIMSRLSGSSEKAKEKETLIKAQQLHGDLVRFMTDVGRYPKTEEGLGALLNNTTDIKNWGGPYVDSEDSLKDSWGNDFEYSLTGKGPQLISNGPEGQPNSPKSIVVINGKKQDKGPESAPAE